MAFDQDERKEEQREVQIIFKPKYIPSVLGPMAKNIDGQ